MSLEVSIDRIITFWESLWRFEYSQGTEGYKTTLVYVFLGIGHKFDFEGFSFTLYFDLEVCICWADVYSRIKDIY